MINLRPYQTDVKAQVFESWNAGVKNVLLVMPTGGGKCLGKSTPVLMYDGSIKLVQDIRPNDLLMGPDSLPKIVLEICQGRSELFKITPVKGDPWVCNDVHVLSLKHSQDNRVIDIPLNKYLEKTSNFKHLFKQFRVGVEFDYLPTEFDPYLLGLYSAEGTRAYSQITTPEPETIKYLQNWCKSNEMKMRITQGNNCKEIHFSSISRRHYANRMTTLRKSCCTPGSSGTRWIPKEYLINNRESRLQLLAGILDGDGHLNHNGFEIITKYDQLNEDILYLCKSLGLAAYSTKTVKTINSIGFSGLYNRIYISGDTAMIPSRVKRKKASARKQIKSVLKTGFKVESIGEGDYYGFELDGDGRFLLGDFTVTHNTKTFCSLVIDTPHLTTAIMVHRKELVQQISLTLAEEGIPHNLIAARSTIKGIIAAQRREFGKQYYNVNAKVTVISVDTLNARHDVYKDWCLSVNQWITDEAAHVLKENKWGRAIAYFKNARGLGVTATPERLDKKGLGSHVDGVFDVMVEGPPTRWMIDQGFLSKYKIAIPDSDYQQYLKSSSSNSDYSKKAMTEASNKSHIVGDVVENYLKFAKGKQAIVFVSDVATAKAMEKEFVKKGVIAKELNGTTPDAERLDALIKFREKEIQVLLNVDLFDEGLDVPGIECVIMARPTKSLVKFLQMVGRGLRKADGKPYLILIDHVGNIKRGENDGHGLPCNLRKWTLDRIRKSQKKLNFLRICSNHECNSPYDRALTECPWCGFEAITQSRSDGGGKITLQQVDGDLTLIDPETIRALEQQSQLEDPGRVGDRVSAAVNAAAGLKAMKNQQERIATQQNLAQVIAQWAGKMRTHYGYTDRTIHKKFYLYHQQTITEVLGESKADMLKTIDELENNQGYY